MIIECEKCGYKATRMDRFKNHRPCNPPSSTVWVSWGSGGQRADNKVVAIAELVNDAFRRFEKISSVSVHHGRCNVGMTTPDPCSCDPTTLLRTRVERPSQHRDTGALA